MKNALWIALVAAGAAGGFLAGGAMRKPAPPPPAEEKPAAEKKPVVKDDSRLLEANKRIAQLEKDLAAVRRDSAKFEKDLAAAKLAAEEKLKENGSKSVVKIGKDGDIMGELKNKLPNDQFTQVTNAFSQLRSKLEQIRKGRQEYLASVDVSGMSARERDNHKRYMELLAKREAISAKMKGGIPDMGAIQEMVQLGIEMEPAAKEERSTLVRQVARELGYTGDDVEVIHDTMKSIYDCTSGGGLGGLGDINEAMGGLGGGLGGGAPDVKVETQVIGL